jgi:hypothetical protein
MKLSIPIVLVISILLASCAIGPLITQVNIKISDTYSRHIWLIPCIQGAQKLVVFDVSGHGNTVPVHWEMYAISLLKYPRHSISRPNIFMFGEVAIVVLS